MPVLSQAFEMAVGQDGWARLDVMGNAIYQVDKPSEDWFPELIHIEFLNVPAGKHLIAMVCIGYPSAEPPSPGRHPLSEKVRRID